MKLKNKLFFTFILALIVCVLLVPCAFADEAEAVNVEQEISVADTVEETVAEPVEETEEPAEVITAIEEAVEESTEEAEAVTEEEVETAAVEEAEAVPEEPKVYADFTAADGSVHSLELGSSVNLGEFMAALGYEGEVSSFASSNPEALDLNEEGQLVFKSAFADAAITVVINGEEVVIPVHDPATINVSGTGEMLIEQAFGYQDSNDNLVITLTGDCETSTTLKVKTGKTITLDLNGHVLSLKNGITESVINVLGKFTLIDNNPSLEHAGYVDGKGLWHPGTGVGTAKTINGGIITGGNNSLGGGIYVDGGSFTFKGGSISGNKATDGAGIYNNGGKVAIAYSSAVANNTATGNGGGIYNTNNGTLSIYAVTISGNKADNGAGIYNSNGRVDVINSATITDNAAEHCGGGIYTDGNGTYPSGCVNYAGKIEGCSANQGGAVYVASNGRFEMINGSIMNCRAIGENALGGAMYIENGKSILNGTADLGPSVKITDCTSEKLGGGIYSEGAVGLEGSTVSNNTAVSAGGGIYLGANGSIFLGSNAKVTGNTADSQANNLYISKDASMVKLGTGEDVKAPKSGMSIGVTTEIVPTVSKRVDVTTIANDKDYTEYFISDNENYIVVNSDDNKVQLAVPTQPVPEAAESVKVYVDGELLTEGVDYNWVNGKVVLTSEFVAALEAGEHILRIEFSGYTVNEDFSIVDGIVVPAEDAKYLAV